MLWRGEWGGQGGGGGGGWAVSYVRNASGEGPDDLGYAASRGVQHAAGAALEQEHAGQMQHQGGVVRVLQLLQQSLPVHEQGLSEGGE